MDSETRFFSREDQHSPFKALPQGLELEADESSKLVLQDLQLPRDPYGSKEFGSLTEDTSDFWEKKGMLWLRHHVRPRLTAFTPTDFMPNGPELQLLEFSA